MRINRSLIAFVLLASPAALVGQTDNSLTPAERAEGWQLLFDGTSLRGWHPAPPVQGGGRAAATPPPAAPGALAQVGSAPAPCVTTAAAPAGASHWQVVDGLLMPCGEPVGYLTSDQAYRNFRLAIEFRCDEEANSGVFVRSPQGNGGYEVQIWKQQPAGYNTGAIVGTARTARDYRFNPGQWNRLEVTADGDHLVVVLNGETTLDIHDTKFSEGNLRLQYQQFPIAFRSIKIRPLL